MQGLTRAALALVIGWGAVASAQAQSVSVTVSGGQVNVSPATVDTSADKRVTYTLRTPGFSFTSISPSSRSVSCSVNSATSASCSLNGTTGNFSVTLGVRSTSGETLPSPDIWIQAN